jgi:hypothetical protein
MVNDLQMPPIPDPPTTEAQKPEAFREVALWLLENYGLLAVGERRGTGLIVPLRTRAPNATALTAFRTWLLPYRMLSPDTNKYVTPLDTWLTLPGRIGVAGFRTEPEKQWPTYTEGDATYVNLYRRPQLPEDGDPRLGHELLETLLPDARERHWYKQRIAHKLRFPAIPGPSVVMIAQDTYGVGRGTWFKVLTGMVGRDYVARPDFTDIIGTSSQSIYNDWIALSVLALVNETSSDEDHKYATKQRAYERIKELVDTSRQIRRIKAKWLPLYECECGPGFDFASNLNTPLALMTGDRRLTFLRNGPAQSPEFYTRVNAWMAVPANIGAFRRDLEAIDLRGFNAYAPLPTTLKDAVIEDSRSAIDEAVDVALENLPGKIFQMVQIIDMVSLIHIKQGLYLRGEWQPLVVREAKKQGHRIGIKDGNNWQPCLPQRGLRAAAYARSEEARKRWTSADHPLVLAELQKNEAAIKKIRGTQGRIKPFDTVS